MGVMSEPSCDMFLQDIRLDCKAEGAVAQNRKKTVDVQLLLEWAHGKDTNRR